MPTHETRIAARDPSGMEVYFHHSFCVQKQVFSACSPLRGNPPGEGLEGCFTTLYNTPTGSSPQGRKVCAQMKLKQTGSVFDNHGLWYYSVQLPGEKKRRQVTLRAPGSKHTLRTDRPRKMAE